MKHVAKALDILQGDKNAKFGFLVPTLKEVRRRLEKQKTKLTENNSVCLPLVNAILDAISTRFSTVLKDSAAIAAAILIPSIKDTWTDDKELLELGSAFLIKLILEPLQVNYIYICYFSMSRI